MVSDIPDDIFVMLAKGAFDDKTKIVRDVGEINLNHGEELYIAIGHHDHSLEMIGCPDLESLPILAEYCETFQTTSVVAVLHVTPLNPEELPYETDHNSVWVIADDFALAECTDIEEATCSIEVLIQKWPSTDIGDFAVLVGKEVSFNHGDYEFRHNSIGD